MMTATLFLTVLTNGKVDVTFHQHTPTGRVKKVGQRFAVLPWDQVLAAFNPNVFTRVMVKMEAQ